MKVVIQLTGECDGWTTGMTTREGKASVGGQWRYRSSVVVAEVWVNESTFRCVEMVVSIKTRCPTKKLTRDTLGSIIDQELL